MKTFIIKHKWTLFFCLIFVTIVLYVAPKQNDYYLDADINDFKKKHLTTILIWAWVAICILLLFILFFKLKSIRQSLTSFLSVSVTTALLLFVFKDLFLAGSLLINRQFKQNSSNRAYIVNYSSGTQETKNNFFPYDLSSGQISIDEKLINKLYQPELKQNDTVTLKFDEGLFGIKILTSSASSK